MKAAKTEILSREAIGKIFERRKRLIGLRMTPMIDMIFLLLLFFLVAAKWRPAEVFLPFQLPSAQTQSYRTGTAKPEPLMVYISATKTGCQVQIGQSYTIQIEDKTIEENLIVLMDKIREQLLAQKRFTGDPIEVVCTPQVRWEYLAKIYNIFYGAGLTDITFAMTAE